MRVKRAADGTPIVTLEKGETTRAMELSYIVQGVAGSLRGQPSDAVGASLDALEELAAGCVAFAKKYGAQHFDEKGALKEPERRKQVAESAPS